jgi:hypothetical protein
MTQSLQVGLSRAPDDIVALCKTARDDPTWIGRLWVAIHATIAKQTHARRQCDEGFSAD